LAPQPARAFKLAGTNKRDRSLAPACILNIRSDLHQVVGIVKERYRLVPNQDVPRLLDQLIQSGRADWTTAGLLRGGAEVWWLARLRETSTLPAETRERIEFHILLVHSHDGSKRTNAALLPLRVSSQTTLAWPLGQTARTVNLKPSGSREDVTDLERLRTLAVAYRTEFERIATQMLRTPLLEQDFAALLKLVLPTPTHIIRNGRVTNQRGITLAENAKGTITQIYFHNPTISHIRGTLWGAVQAVQYYSDHHTINRNTDDTSAAENHFKRITSATTLGSRFFLHALRLAAKR